MHLYFWSDDENAEYCKPNYLSNDQLRHEVWPHSRDRLWGARCDIVRIVGYITPVRQYSTGRGNTHTRSWDFLRGAIGFDQRVLVGHPCGTDNQDHYCFLHRNETL